MIDSRLFAAELRAAWAAQVQVILRLSHLRAVLRVVPFCLLHNGVVTHIANVLA